MSDSVTGAGSPFDQHRTYSQQQRAQDDRERIQSIWQERKQHLFDNSGSPPISGQPPSQQQQQQQQQSPFRSRARAGTLPSRLSPGLQINPNVGALGSLALLSPDHNSPDDVLLHQHHHHSAGSSVSLHEDQLASLAQQQKSFPHPLQQVQQHQQQQQQQHSHSPGVVPFPQIPPQQSPLSQQQRARGMPPTSASSTTTGSTSSRLRSGSLNLLSDARPSFSPFGSSIWSNSPSAAGTPPREVSSGVQTPNRLSQQPMLPTIHPEEEPVMDDPMQPFLNELRMQTDVNRLRSYTVTALPPGQGMIDEEALRQQQYHHQQQKLQEHRLQQQHYLNNARPRAQTTSAAALSDRMLPTVAQNSTAPPSRPYSSGYEQPNEDASRSLWLGNVPASTTSYALQAIFSPYGYVESARVLPHKNCAFVDFSSLECAVQARNVLNGQELFSGSGPCKVGYAKTVPVEREEHSPEPRSNSVDDIEYSVVDHHSHENLKGSASEQRVEWPTKSLEEISDEMVDVIRAMGASEEQIKDCAAAIKRAMDFKDFKDEVSPVPEPSPDRIYDAPTLREVRKRVDGGNCTDEQIEEIAIEMLDDMAELSSDYVGNTVVQKLFDTCSEAVKDMMLRRISPYLAQIGVHKNGTWAAQKIIDVAGTARQIHTITTALRPYTVHLFLDQYGNYVIQCCLKFGGPWNDYIFETMLSRFWDIAQGRFGARAMRACLESSFSTKEQQQTLAAAIALHAVQLATNANGALLLTWFLDTCALPNRHAILAPMLVPHLVELCTHKLACLTVLKVINHKGDPEVRQLIFNALFESDAADSTLEKILSDHLYGPTFIYKVISAPVVEFNERQVAVQKIRNVLMAIKALPNQGYKRLMDEVGLSTRQPSQRSANGPNKNNRNNNGNMNNHQQRRRNHDHSPQKTHSQPTTPGIHHPQHPQHQQQQEFFRPGPPQQSSSQDMIQRFDQMGLDGYGRNGMLSSYQNAPPPQHLAPQHMPPPPHHIPPHHLQRPMGDEYNMFMAPPGFAAIPQQQQGNQPFPMYDGSIPPQSR